MRQTNNPGAFRSTNANDYVFTDRKSGSGSHSISGTRVITSSANLTGNTEYYIWCFGQGDDGVSGYQSGFINVFGLNV